jgi:mRNA interferase MazF
MKQRDIYLADLNPTLGQEQKGTRPVVIISGNAMNDHLKVSIICPLTSKIKKYAGCVVLAKDEVNNLSQDSEIITFQVRTVAQERLIRKIGEITEEQLERVKTGLVEILSY